MLELMTGAASRKDKLLNASVPVAAAFLAILSKHVKDGDLFGLFDKFATHDLIGKLESWIGRGDDVLLTPDEAKKILGTDLPALEAGLASTKPELKDEALLKELVKVFPVVVRRFTRSGQIPPQRILERSIADVAQSFNIKA